MKLLPCAHCGGQASYDNNERSWAWIICNSCGVRIHGARISEGDTPLTEQWNKRVPYVHAGVPARRQKIEAFRSLGENWDSYGCEAFSQKSVDAALAMEPLLPASFVSVVPLSDGGVMFGTKGELVTVEIYADVDADVGSDISLPRP